MALLTDSTSRQKKSGSTSTKTVVAPTSSMHVAVEMNVYDAMVLCSFMLSNILRNGKSYVSEDEEAEFLYACRKFALSWNIANRN